VSVQDWTCSLCGNVHRNTGCVVNATVEPWRPVRESIAGDLEAVIQERDRYKTALMEIKARTTSENILMIIDGVLSDRTDKPAPMGKFDHCPKCNWILGPHDCECHRKIEGDKSLSLGGLAQKFPEKGDLCVEDQHRGTECRCDHIGPHCCSHHCCCFYHCKDCRHAFDAHKSTADQRCEFSACTCPKYSGEIPPGVTGSRITWVAHCQSGKDGCTSGSTSCSCPCGACSAIRNIW
jgi:hypothetical protein